MTAYRINIRRRVCGCWKWYWKCGTASCCSSKLQGTPLFIPISQLLPTVIPYSGSCQSCVMLQELHPCLLHRCVTSSHLHFHPALVTSYTHYCSGLRDRSSPRIASHSAEDAQHPHASRRPRGYRETHHFRAWRYH